MSQNSYFFSLIFYLSIYLAVSGLTCSTQDLFLWSMDSLGWEDPLEKGKATHSSILAWKIPWTVHGVAKSWTQLSDFHFQHVAKGKTNWGWDPVSATHVLLNV